MTTIDLVYFNAGGGHRASALAIRQAVQELGLPWTIRLVDLFEVLDPRDLFRKVTGRRPEDLYNGRLARGWTMGMAQELKLLQGGIRLCHRPMTARLRRHWAASAPDAVVSLVPNFNRALYESLGAVRPGVPYVTILTDLADYPPRFWIERGQRQHIVCGTPRAVAQARAMGYADWQVHATSGVVIRPDFYRQTPIDRAAERRRLGLDPGRLTGVVLFGGHGSRAMHAIARRLPDVPLILLCGHNRALAAQLRAMKAEAPRVVLEYSGDIPYYMKLADFFIGKPGPGSISEAVRQGLPVIVASNRATMPQERYNAQWIRENGVGLAVPSFRSIGPAVAELCHGLDRFRANVARIDNRAVFEIPDILARILESGAAAGRDAA
ncbi:hypothetical protein GCM10023144_18990 [Pigmentiphaga soli]|uniref:Glycosyl transferase family 28 C-terminal domain-containing protein n=1 Tax=Pigmentiphaga soli TaxID=1007095 RepID=A0ABP8GWF8_9BURK